MLLLKLRGNKTRVYSLRMSDTENKDVRLEIPTTYLFYHKKPSKVKKLVIRDKEDRAEVN